jgi:hypothetical protein
MEIELYRDISSGGERYAAFAEGKQVAVMTLRGGQFSAVCCEIPDDYKTLHEAFYAKANVRQQFVFRHPVSGHDGFRDDTERRYCLGAAISRVGDWLERRKEAKIEADNTASFASFR